MIDYLTLGPVPAGESCQQVGTETYDHQAALAECRRYRDQLGEMFPDAKFGVKSFPHDFGSYYEVVVFFETEAEADRAFEIEKKCPMSWNTEGNDGPDHGATPG